MVHPARSWGAQFLFELIQVGVRRGIAEGAAHCNDLTFVVESVGEDVVEDERWGADGGVSVGKMQLRTGVEMLLAEA
jgi:hypothetical protein